MLANSEISGDPRMLANSESTGVEGSFFGLATCTSVLLEKIVLFSASFPGEARPKLPLGRGMTRAKDSEDYKRLRLVSEKRRSRKFA